MTSRPELDLFGNLDRNLAEPLALHIVNPNVADQIVSRLTTAIALGVYVPGQRLPAVRDLAEMLKVSRTVVHEALHRLADEGYIEVRRGRNGGSYVRAEWGPGSAEMVASHLLPNWPRFKNLFDARQLIDPLIARVAAERRTTAELRTITEAVERYKDAPDREASRHADELLHRSIGEATHNPMLVGLLMQFRSAVSLNLGAEPYTKKVHDQAVTQHAALAEAIKARDGDLAASIAADHTQLSEKLIRNLVRRARSNKTTP